MFRLDDKKWQIPGGPARGDFNELIDYLAEQAATIVASSVDVESLKIIGILCGSEAINSIRSSSLGASASAQIPFEFPTLPLSRIPFTCIRIACIFRL